MSDESSSIVEKYVKENKITWLTASNPGGKTMREYGATGYPSAYLIDPSGKIAWAGHPVKFPEDQLKELLKDVKPVESKSGSTDKSSSDGKSSDGDKKDE